MTGRSPTVPSAPSPRLIDGSGPQSGPKSFVWANLIDGWLAHIRREIFEHVNFHLALIGFEEAGEAYARELNGVVPEERWAGYLLPHQGKLLYEPANR
ncbi:hypothetical protein SAMN05192558_101697 [Actinokineospora alba]|uniref:Uncharacterized protein n=1 Tax=Actinokineospora alba TaxID=504798 RepID=A0A1H0G7W3_9PSEU|nr:hypothetical protein C8E96_5392 [Actinokineospora alba]SDI08500.1 hypothetical protein SAMN05421871_103174 [Actinokineospora alba]SDO02940.1 hypothetical protein SAMN05192558_101697 [Actinokineospora alba]